MKKLLALCMTLAMTLALASPVLAAEEGADRPERIYLSEGEFTDQYMDAHPEHYAAFDAGAYFAEEYGDWYTKEAYMADWDLETEEDFKQNMWQEYLSYTYSMDEALYNEVNDAYTAYLLELYESRHPGELDSLKTEDMLARLGYTETLTPAEQLMKDWYLDSAEEVRPALLTDYVKDRLETEQVHADFLGYQEEYPEEWAAFDADAYFEEMYGWYGSYTDKEEYMNCWHLFTEEEFVEAMFVEYVMSSYWEWNYEEEEWWYPWYEEELSPALVANGERVDAVLTAEDGVTYTDAATLNTILGTSLTGDRVAIREAATAAGWDVGWNQFWNTVYLIDRETVMAELEEATAAVSTILAWQGKTLQWEEGKTLKSTETVELALTIFNSLDGDKTYTATVTGETVVDSRGMSATLTADLRPLLNALDAQALEELPDLLPENITVGQLRTLLQGAEIKVYWDFAEGKLCICAPVLALFLNEWEAETWYFLDMGTGLELETALTQLFDLDMAGLLYDQLLEQCADGWYHPEWAYRELIEELPLLSALFGKDTITAKGNTTTWQVTTEGMNAAMSSMTGAPGSYFKDYHITVSMQDDGGYTMDMGIRPDMEGIAWAGTQDSYYLSDAGRGALSFFLSLLDSRITAAASGDGRHATETAEYHWKNQIKLTMETDSTQTVTTESPASILPANPVMKPLGG